MKEGKVLFNEQCSICNYEIKHYKKRSELSFSDCSHMDDKYLKRLHVVFENGEELTGVDAFIYVWKRTDGYMWLAKFTSLPIVYRCSKIAYSFVAFLLFWRFKLVLAISGNKGK